MAVRIVLPDEETDCPGGPGFGSSSGYVGNWVSSSVFPGRATGRWERTAWLSLFCCAKRWRSSGWTVDVLKRSVGLWVKEAITMSVVSHIAAQRTNHGVPHAVSCRLLLGVSESWFYKWRSCRPTAIERRRAAPGCEGKDRV